MTDISRRSLLGTAAALGLGPVASAAMVFLHRKSGTAPSISSSSVRALQALPRLLKPMNRA